MRESIHPTPDPEPVPGNRRTVRRAGIGIVLAAALTATLAACASGSDQGVPAEKPAASQPSVVPDAEITKDPAIGVPVTDGDIEFVVNSVTYTDAPMEDGNYAPLAPKGRFAKVNVSATALAEVGMYLGDITVTTAQVPGEVTPAVGAMMYDGTLNPDYMHKGQTLRGDVVFDIAEGDTVTSVLLKANPMSEGVTVPVT